MQVAHGGPPGPIYALYGAREALLLPPLPLADDDTAIHAVLDARWHLPAVREGFRQALIAQGIWALPDIAGLYAQSAQSAHALKTSGLRLAPVSVTGLQPVKTEPAKAALSGDSHRAGFARGGGKLFVMPPRINPPSRPRRATRFLSRLPGNVPTAWPGCWPSARWMAPKALRMLPFKLRSMVPGDRQLYPYPFHSQRRACTGGRTGE